MLHSLIVWILFGLSGPGDDLMDDGISSLSSGPDAASDAVQTLIDDANAAAEQWGCDPIETVQRGAERPPYTKDQRSDTYRRVIAQCYKRGGTKQACELAKILTVRESSGRAGVRHRLPKDAAFALDSYINQAHRYGWRVVWPWDDRWAGPGIIRFDTVDLTPIEDSRNQHYMNPMRWMTGLGPLSFNPSTHLWRSGEPNLPPEWLCVPENSTDLLMDTFRRAVKHYGATTLTEVNAVFAGAVADNKPKARPERDKLFCDRLAGYGMDCNAEPKLFR